MNALALRADDLRIVRGEPRVTHSRLSVVLGFSREKGVRRLVSRHYAELASHGDLVTETVPTKQVVQGGRPADVIHLNEAQALLICMFSRTNEAAAARKQIIEVFLAYRHGKLVPAGRKRPANDRDLPWAKMEQRIKRIERMIDIQAKVESEAFANALAYAPTILYLDGAGGKPKKQTRPRWWYDREVREAVIACHRQMTVDIATESLKQQFGKGRGPSRSSIGRFWLVLDQVRAAS